MIYIGVSTDRKNFFSRAIRFFTRSDISHTFTYMGKFLKFNQIFAANEFISNMYRLEDYYIPDEKYRIYAVENKSGKSDEEILSEFYAKYNMVIYSHLGLLWFIWRWFRELIGFPYKSKAKNWFTYGAVCTEDVYHLLCMMGYEYKLKEFLPYFDKNTVHALDIERFLKSIYSTLVEYKEYDEFPVIVKSWR